MDDRTLAERRQFVLHCIGRRRCGRYRNGTQLQRDPPEERVRVLAASRRGRRNASVGIRRYRRSRSDVIEASSAAGDMVENGTAPRWRRWIVADGPFCRRNEVFFVAVVHLFVVVRRRPTCGTRSFPKRGAVEAQLDPMTAGRSRPVDRKPRSHFEFAVKTRQNDARLDEFRHDGYVIVEGTVRRRGARYMQRRHDVAVVFTTSRCL